MIATIALTFVGASANAAEIENGVTLNALNFNGLSLNALNFNGVTVARAALKEQKPGVARQYDLESATQLLTTAKQVQNLRALAAESLSRR